MTRQTWKKLANIAASSPRFRRFSGKKSPVQPPIHFVRKLAAGLAFSGFSVVLAAAALSKPPLPKTSSTIGDVRMSADFEIGKSDLEPTKSAGRKADALANYVQGLLYEEDGNSDKATSLYERVMELDPVGIDAKLAVRIATEYVRRGNVPQAISLLKDIAKAQPGEPLPFVTLSYIYLKELNKTDLALQYAREAVAAAPYDLRGYQAEFVVLDAIGQPDEIEKSIDKAAHIDSKDSDFWFGIGDLYLRFYSKTQSEDQIDLLKLQKVTAIYEKALAQAPDDASVAGRVGDYYTRIGDLKKAIPLYQKAVAEGTDASESTQVDIREKLAKIFFGMGKRPEAIEMLKGVVKINPLRSDAYVLLGEIYEKNEDLPQALDNFNQALLTGKAEARNYLRVAQTALRLKKYQLAIDTLVDARARFASPEFTTLLAIAYSQNGQNNEAMQKFEEAISEASNYDGNTLNSGFYLSYADAAQKAGLFDKTVELIQKSMQIDPDNVHEGQNFLGYFWIDRGENLEAAGQLIRQALLAEPGNGAYLDSLGWYYFKTERFDLAIKQLLKAAENLEKDDPVVFDHIAQTYLKLGKKSEAIDYWQKALKLDDGNKDFLAKIEAAKKS